MPESKVYGLFNYIPVVLNGMVISENVINSMQTGLIIKDEIMNRNRIRQRQRSMFKRSIDDNIS